ncbi:dGTPase [Rhodococcus sp. PvP016]|nr:dGTPase [Rhodococcus sp. PvP016]
MSDGSLSAEELIATRYARRSGPAEIDRGGGDFRTPTERDLGRVLYSENFRRLAGVTQIVSPSLRDTSTHNRLSHSLRVSQLSREIAVDILRFARLEESAGRGGVRSPVGIAKSGGIDITACAAAGLAHDIGHSPYGHAVGRLLDSWIREVDTDGYEGNAQTLRIVTELAPKPESAHGLDLTAVTLSALLKYPYTRKAGSDKFSMYSGQPELLKFARDALPESDRNGVLRASERQSLEANIVSLADDITYATHDLEDFLRLGLLDINEVIEMLSITSQTLSDLELGDLREDPNVLIQSIVLLNPKETSPVTLEHCTSALRSATSQLKRLAGLVQHQYSDPREVISQVFTVMLGKIIRSIKVLDKPYWDGGPVIMPSPEQWFLTQIMKEVSQTYIIRSSAVSTQERAHKSIVMELLPDILDWITDVTHPAELPPSLREHYTRHGSPNEDGKAARRVVVDYLCSITDAQTSALRLNLRGYSGPLVLTDGT